MRRHTVIDSKWDAAKREGKLKFRCNHCGYEYWWLAVYKNLWDIKPPKDPGERATRRRRRFAEWEIKHFAKYWGFFCGAKGEGVSVSECKGCLPKRPARSRR